MMQDDCGPDAMMRDDRREGDIRRGSHVEVIHPGFYQGLKATVVRIELDSVGNLIARCAAAGEERWLPLDWLRSL